MSKTSPIPSKIKVNILFMSGIIISTFFFSFGELFFINTQETITFGVGGDSILEYGQETSSSSWNEINSSDYIFWSFYSSIAKITVFAMDDENYDKYYNNEPGWTFILLSQNKTSDQGYFYPLYQDVWYILFLNEDPIGVTTHIDHFVSVNYIPINIVGRVISLIILAIGAFIFILVLLIKIKNQGKENKNKFNINYDNHDQKHFVSQDVNNHLSKNNSLLTVTNPNLIVCSFCKEKMPQNNTFCSNCGAKIGTNHK